MISTRIECLDRRQRRTATSAAILATVAGSIVVSNSHAATLTRLASFNGTNGSSPFGGLVRDGAGNLYGTTESDQVGGGGTIFKVSAGSNAITTLADLNDSSGRNPFAGLTRDLAGNLYGTTYNGGDQNLGSVIKFDVATATLSTLASFNGADGAFPAASLIVDSAGNLFGTTVYGGVNDAGTVFRLDAGATSVTTLASLSQSGGMNPFSTLTRDLAGNLYGTASAGGINGRGTVFKVAAGTNALSTVAAFSGTTTGDSPNGGVVVDAAGNLYGSTYHGGASDVGAIYRIASGTSTVTRLASLATANGTRPLGELIMDAAGNLYGTTSAGGTSGAGTIVRIAAGTNAITVLATFNTTDGATPFAGLIADASGNLYGTTQAGGANGFGSIFRLTDTGFFTAIQWASNADGGWDQADRWTCPSVPNASWARVTLGSNGGVIIDARTITLDTVATVARLNFDHAAGYAINGSGTLTIAQDATPGIAVLAGHHTIDAVVALAENTTIDIAAGSSLSIDGTLIAAGRTVTKSGDSRLDLVPAVIQRLAIDAGEVGLGVGTFDIDEVTIDPSATLHLDSAALRIDYDGGSPASSIRDAIVAGRIVSDRVTTTNRAIGWLDTASMPTLATFDNAPLDGSTLLVVATLRGDADLDLAVDFDDLLVLATFYISIDQAWQQGDFTYDGNVDFDDLLALAQNYNASLSPAQAASFEGSFAADFALARSLVPEPGVGLLVAGCFFGCRRRRIQC